MYFLYPKLPLPAANELIRERSTMSLDDLIEISKDIHHADIQYAATGGRKADRNNVLYPLQKSIRDSAYIFGYPYYPANRSAAREFDYDCALVLHKGIKVHPSEASDIRMWAYIACLLTPDIVLWRFPDSNEDVEEDINRSGGQSKIARLERFIGSDRGLRRNTFGRLWWRAYLLYDDNNEDNPYWMLKELFEDEVVQITERNSIASSPSLLTAFAKGFLQAIEENPHITRRTLMRESVKRLRRLLPILAFDVLDSSTVVEILGNIFSETIVSLEKA